MQVNGQVNDEHVEDTFVYGEGHLIKTHLGVGRGGGLRQSKRLQTALYPLHRGFECAQFCMVPRRGDSQVDGSMGSMTEGAKRLAELVWQKLLQ